MVSERSILEWLTHIELEKLKQRSLEESFRNGTYSKTIKTKK